MGCGEWGRILVFLHVLSMWACGGGGGFIDIKQGGGGGFIDIKQELEQYEISCSEVGHVPLDVRNE